MDKHIPCLAKPGRRSVPRNMVEYFQVHKGVGTEVSIGIAKVAFAFNTAFSSLEKSLFMECI